MINLVIFVIILAICFGCVRMKTKKTDSVIPVFTFACGLMVILGTIAHVIYFKASESKHITEVIQEDVPLSKIHVGKNFLGEYIVRDGDEARYFWRGLPKVILDSTTFFRDFRFRRRFNVGLPLDIKFYEDEVTELHLTPDDYEIYRAAIDSLDKGN